MNGLDLRQSICDGRNKKTRNTSCDQHKIKESGTPWRLKGPDKERRMANTKKELDNSSLASTFIRFFSL